MAATKTEKFLGSLIKVLTVCACCLFLVSALFPFSTVPYFSIIPEDAYDVTYWSYKTIITHIKLGQNIKSDTVFFNNYWFAPRKSYSPPPPTDLGVQWILIGMFLAQILTVCIGVSTLFTRKKMVQFLPSISCLSVTVMMVYVMMQAQNQTYGLPSYGLGYWLTYPSALLFIIAFTIHRRARLLKGFI